MKREYLIGGVFFVLFLAFMVGIISMGGKHSESPQTQIAVSTPPPTLPQPSPTIVFKPVSEEPALPVNTSQIIQSVTAIEYWIAGYVTDEEGKALLNSAVMVSIEKKGSLSYAMINKKAVTDEKGYYTIHLDGPTKGYIRSTPPEEYQTLGGDFSLTPEQPTLAKHFTHPRAPHFIQGKVIDAKTKNPISGAEITAMCIRSVNKEHPQWTEKAISKEDGSYKITRLTQGQYSLMASAEGYVHYLAYKVIEYPLNQINVPGDSQDREHIIEMQPGLAATFHVVNAMGRSIDQAEIKITSEEDKDDVVGNSTTDRNGLATNNNLPNQTLYAEALHQTEGRGFSQPFTPGMATQPVRVEIAVQTFASISGKVLDSEGHTVPDKEVDAELHDIPGWKYPTNLRVEPDLNGNYSLDMLAPGSYRISITRSHHYPVNPIQSQTLALKAGEHRTDVDFIVGKEDTLDIQGKVIDGETSESLEGISVMAYPASDSGGYFNDSVHAKTDAQGEFHLTGLVKKSDQIQFTLQGKDEYLSISHKRPYGESYYTLPMKKGGQISGIVLDDNDTPLAGAEIYPVRMYDGSSYHDTHNTQTTGENGAFTFNNLTPMDYKFHAKMEGFLQADSETISIRGGKKIDTIVIRLKKGIGIYGSIIDPQGQPIANAMISILSNVPDISKNSWGHPFSKPHYPQDAISDQSGQFQIENFPPQGDTLVVQHDNFAPVLYAIDSSTIDQSPFTIRMTLGGSIVGTTYGTNGKKEANVVLNTQNWPDSQFKYKTRSDEEGEYRFEHLIPASYMVLNFGPDDEFDNHQSKTVQVEEGKVARCDFGGGEGATVHGTVYKRGQISPNAKLVLEMQATDRSQRRNSFNTVSDEQGVYSFSALDPGVYTISVTTDSSETTNPSQPLFPGNCEYSTSVTITENRSDYLVDLRIASLEIRGIVLDEETNEPIAGAKIETRYKTTRKFPDIIQAGDIQTKEDGAFTLLPTESGTATLIAMKDGYRAKEFEITVPPFSTGETVQPIPVTVLMKKDDMGVYLRLFVEGKPAECSWIHVAAQNQEYNPQLLPFTQIETGYYRAYGMLEGEWEIKVSAYCFAKVLETLPQTITIRPGEKPQLMLNLYEMDEFGVFLVTPNHKTVEGLALIELLGLPEPVSYHVPIRSFPQRELFNLLVVNIPSGVSAVRIHPSGYRPVEFRIADYPKESREVNPESLIRLPLTPQ